MNKTRNFFFFQYEGMITDIPIFTSFTEKPMRYLPLITIIYSLMLIPFTSLLLA